MTGTWWPTTQERADAAYKAWIDEQCNSPVMIQCFLILVSVAGPLGVTLAQLPDRGQPGPGNWDQAGYAWLAGLILFALVALWMRRSFRREDKLRSQYNQLKHRLELEKWYEEEGA